MNERDYQKELIKRIKKRFPGCTVMKTDPVQQQGIPDILILFQRTWAMLEVKMDSNSPRQPNQEHYVAHYNELSFASFINPDNEEEVLDALQSTFGSTRSARVS